MNLRVAAILPVHHGIRIISFILILAALLVYQINDAIAQEAGGTPTPAAPGEEEGESDIPRVHIVQEGETLFGIAEQYSTTIEELQFLNNISDPTLLFVGQELIIPGGGGERVFTVHTIGVGDTLRGIATAYNTSVEDLALSNNLVNPGYLVAGRQLSVSSRTGSAAPLPIDGTLHIVEEGDTLLGLAARYGVDPDKIVSLNDLGQPTYLFAGQRLRLPGDERFQFLSDHWQRLAMYPATISQGQSAAIYLESALPGRPNGQIGDQQLHFLPYADGYLALFGLDAFAEPGLYTLELTGEGEQPWRPLVQRVEVFSGSYGLQNVTVPDELAPLLEPGVRQEEDEHLASIYNQLTDVMLWDGPFTMPVTGTVVTAPYGDARSYNQGPVEILHTGIDFAGVIGTPIYAPAAGNVIYSDTLSLRGQTLIIDHGFGLMTGYYHLSRIHVDVGAPVVAGQLIAEGGSTGLSTGPHLHWDLRIMNVPVDGMQWTREDLADRLLQ